MRLLASVAVTLLVSIALAASQAVPPALSALAAKAGITEPLVAWCGGEFRPGRPEAFAVAVRAAQGAGRYLVIERDGQRFELSSFLGRGEVACYTPAEARRLSAVIAASDTIHGAVNPRWATTVICGFVEDTRAICWQFSPAAGRFVQVGEWVT